MKRATAIATIALRAAALGATLWVLVATTSLGPCPDWSAPVAFRAQGSCGPGGVIVVAPNHWSTATIANEDSLGLPPNATATYTGTACPILLGKGAWKVQFGEPGDASCTQTATDGATTTGPCTTTCTVDEVATGPLQFICTDGSGMPLCASTLTEIK